MADHYRTLAQSLVGLGFLFRRQGEGRQEVWRNRQTDREVTFDRDEVSKSRAAADAVLATAQAGGVAPKAVITTAESGTALKAPSKALAKPLPKSSPGSSPKSSPKESSRKPAAAPKPASKPSRHATTRNKSGRAARQKGKR